MIDILNKKGYKLRYFTNKYYYNDWEKIITLHSYATYSDNYGQYLKTKGFNVIRYEGAIHHSPTAEP